MEIKEQAARTLEKRIAEFEKASGIKFDGWTGGRRIGEAVGFVLDGGFDRLRTRSAALRNLATEIETLARRMDEVRQEMSREVEG